MLAVDASDAYWIVRHRAVEGEWPTTRELLEDEEAAAACWAWENFYLGMTITGTIYNEFRLPPPVIPGSPLSPSEMEPAPAGRARMVRDRAIALLSSLSAMGEKPGGVVDLVRQHEPSGGGRSVPQHRRLYAAAREPKHVKRVVQQASGEFRRTMVRRSPEEIAAAWHRLAADTSMMIASDVRPEPAPSDVNCPPCPFRGPCQAMFAGEDAEAILRSAYRERPRVILEEGRLGGGAWSQNRGAAPPRFRGKP
jgi:hypothetical protein